MKLKEIEGTYAYLILGTDLHVLNTGYMRAQGLLYNDDMRLRQKIILFALAPLVLALSAISLTVYHQATSLVQQEREVIKPAYLATKESELKNYVALATQAISHLYESGKTDAATKDAAREILAKLEYGEDGYLFLYDLEGTMLMHPRLKESVGKNMWNLADPNGKMIIQDLIRIARTGGGFYDYVWPKPSANSNDPKPKRSYAIELPAWGWMLGTGVYLDDIDTALAEVDQKASNNITSTMLWILAIMLLSLILIISMGLVLNIWEQRDTQENERKRIARALHGDIGQRLGAIGWNVETVIVKLKQDYPGDLSTIVRMLKHLKARLDEETNRIRKISRILDPRILLDFGLEPAIREIVASYNAVGIACITEGELGGLPDISNVALYRTCQISLDNIKRHANATQITVRLEGNERDVTLTVKDNGAGFDVNRQSSGLGLPDMKETVEDERIGGKFTIMSTPQGTTVIATVPRKPNNLLITLLSWNRKNRI
jgi:two-component system NarL family sensor kinase